MVENQSKPCLYYPAFAGRAESAPRVRETPGTKTTMAEAMMVEAGLHPQGENGECEPVMPHRIHAKAELEVRYPPLEAVDAVDDEDMGGEDQLLRRGEKVAEEIVKKAVDHGRRRMQKG